MIINQRYIAWVIYSAIIFSNKSFSQNLVPNYSFENFVSCPDNDGQINRAFPWFSPNGKTTDFTHPCNSSINGWATNPSNQWGYQAPATGDGMAGIWTWLGWSYVDPNYREYLATELLTSLEKDSSYFVSFKVSPGENSWYLSDDIGLFLSENPIPNAGVLSLVPQIQNSEGNIVNNYKEWTQISGYYKAKGNERYLVIGNFKDDANTTLFLNNTTGGQKESVYYFIDDVEVIKDRNCQNFLKKFMWPDHIEACAGDVVKIGNTIPDVTFTWQDGSNDQTMSVTQSGEYWVDIRHKNCVYRKVTNVNFTPLPELKIDQVVSICDGESAIISLNESFDSYQWSNGSAESQITVNTPGNVSVTVANNSCYSHGVITVKVDQRPEKIFNHNSIMLCEERAVLTTQQEFSSYLWSDGSTSPSIEVDKSGLYSVTTTNACGTFEDSIELFSADESSVFLPNIITPNDDGFNESFILDERLLNSEVEVYNSWGNTVFHTHNYLNDWGGRNLSTGAYYYIVRSNNWCSKKLTLKGWLAVQK
jgi:hypothetical protein